MKQNIRDKIWQYFLKSHPLGAVLSKRLIIIRWLLFPLDSFFWNMADKRGYDFRTDTWTIHGIKYSNEFFLYLSWSNGDVFKVTRDGNTVNIEKLQKGTTVTI